MAILPLILLTITIAYIFYQYIIYPFYFSPLCKIPNAHLTSPFSNLWLTCLLRRRGPNTRRLLALHQQLGPIIQLAPKEISVCTPAAMRTIYMGSFEKTTFDEKRFTNYGVKNLVSMRAHGQHSAQKRMLSNVYSKSYAQNSEDLQVISHTLIYHLILPMIMVMISTRGGEMDIFEFAQGVDMDFVSAYIFGLQNGSNFIGDSHARGQWLDEYRTNFKDEEPKKRLGGRIEQWCMGMCEGAEESLQQQRQRQGNQQLLDQDSPAAAPNTQPVVYKQLSRALMAQSPTPSISTSDTKQPSREIITATASEMLDHLVAGHETSAITLTYLIYSLSLDPSLQTRLRAELLTLDPPIKFPRDTTNNHPLPTARSIDALPFLDALLQETLRLYAPIPAEQPRVTPHTPNGTSLETHSCIPGGIIVHANAYTLHRNADVFPEPETWLPQRWLDASDERKAEMRRWWWAFGSGGRMCVGSHFAVQVMKLQIAAIYTNFTTEIVDDGGIEQSDDYIARPVGDRLVVRFRTVSEGEGEK